MGHISRNIKNNSAESNGDCDISIKGFQRGRILEIQPSILGLVVISGQSYGAI